MPDQAAKKLPKAVLTRSDNPFYRFNALIESLPDYENLRADALKARMARHNYRLPEDILLSSSKFDAEQKISLIKAFSPGLFIPLQRHVILLRAIHQLILLGYQDRNPISREALYRAAVRYDEEGQKIEYPQEEQQAPKIDEDKIEEYEFAEKGALKYSEFTDNAQGAVPTTSPAISVIGWSGLGKSHAINRLLSLYPQALRHPRTAFTLGFIQVVWLKVDCPPKPLPNELCSSVLQALDEAIGTSYAEKMQSRMPLERAASLTVKALKAHYVGLLVIDEIQNIVNQPNSELFFNFIVYLSAKVKTSLLFVGTPKINEFIKKDLRLARRLSSMEHFDWELLSNKGTGLSGSEFLNFCRALFEYNLCPEQSVQSTNEIIDALYEKSLGHAETLFKLFFLTQAECLSRNTAFNAKAVRSTYNMYFKTQDQLIKAIAQNKPKAIEKYQKQAMTDDEYLDHIDEHINEVKEEQDKLSSRPKKIEDAEKEQLAASARQKVQVILHDFGKFVDTEDEEVQARVLEGVNRFIEERVLQDHKTDYNTLFNLAIEKAEELLRDESSRQNNDKL